MLYRTRRGMRHAFTLVELIVTMAIVAVLAAMLVPTSSSVRRSVGDLSCVSTMQQLLTGLMCCTMENRG
jgi:prepilin-type N-terminal cleavage/methylation domain-containing protein